MLIGCREAAGDRKTFPQPKCFYNVRRMDLWRGRDPESICRYRCDLFRNYGRSGPLTLIPARASVPVYDAESAVCAETRESAHPRF